eukprot:2787855-Amphidinium_carterae.1
MLFQSGHKSGLVNFEHHNLNLSAESCPRLRCSHNPEPPKQQTDKNMSKQNLSADVWLLDKTPTSDAKDACVSSNFIHCEWNELWSNPCFYGRVSRGFPGVTDMSCGALGLMALRVLNLGTNRLTGLLPVAGLQGMLTLKELKLDNN